MPGHSQTQICIDQDNQEEPSSLCMMGGLLPKMKDQTQIQEHKFGRDKKSKSEIVIKRYSPVVSAEVSIYWGFYNIQKTKIMASGPITSWEIDGETVSDFILGGFKITADSDCSHEIKRHLLLGRKVMTNLDSIFKSRDITNKCPSSQGYGFSSGHVWI